ncbi:MAG: serine/threonine-protein kinase [Bryobacteraceae bacterium]|jgi:non-specific serine/threonine protein kinase/serine/threonine-protein kinase
MPSEPVDPFWQRVEELFQEAWDREAGVRPSYLAGACGGDERLRKAVADLLDASTHAASNPLWDETAIRNEARFQAAGMAAGNGATTLDRYRLMERIGAGGMGVVYKAVRADDEYSKLVAIKIVQDSDPATVRRLRQERQILAGLEHPHIARLLDGGTTADGRPFLVMEYVAGVPVDRYVAAARLPLRELLELFRKICSAVSYAHRNLIVHRDLKPANILVTAEGQPKLLDFGIAKLLDGSAQRTKTGAGAMTPQYASPEQVLGAPITTASDVYSLGVLLYELLSGARPYRNTTGALELAQAILKETPRLIGAHAGRRVDRDLENIVQMALRKEPERRYPSADLLSEDLRQYMSGYPVMARPASRGYRLARFAGRNKAPVAALAVVLLALVAGIAATTWEARIANERFNDVRQLAHAVVFDYHDAIEALPGSTPVRQRLVKDALVYLDKLSRQSGDTSLQREMVEAYVKIGNVQGNSYNSNLGDMAGGLASLRKAVAAGERLVARDPNGLNQRALASAYSAEADILYSQNDLAAADREYRRAASLAEAAVRKLPPDLETRRQWAGTLRNWGDLAGAEGISNMGKPEVALARYRRSLEIVSGLVKEYPGSRPARKDLYDNLLVLAEAEAGAGHRAAAEKQARAALAMIQEISAADPGNATDKVEVANMSTRLAQVLMDDAKAGEAVPLVLAAESIMQMQVQSDPANRLFRRNLEVTELHVVNALRKSGDPVGALAHAQNALALSRQLSAADAQNIEILSDVANCHLKIAQVQMDTHDYAAALGNALKSIVLLDSLLARTPDSNLARIRIRAGLAAGDIELRMDRPAAALAHYAQAGKAAAEVVSGAAGQIGARTDLARSQTGAAAANERLRHWREALNAYRSAGQTWSALRGLQALAPEDAGQPEKAEAAMARCQRHI